MRTKIKRLLRKHKGDLPVPTAAASPNGGGGSSAGGGDGVGLDPINYFTQLVLDQAKSLYRYWPEVGDRLFAEI